MTDGQKIAAAGVTFEVLFTPGHTFGRMLLLRGDREHVVQWGYTVSVFRRKE